MKSNFIYLCQQDVIQCGGLDIKKAICDLEEVMHLNYYGGCITPSKLILRKGTQQEEGITGRINGLAGYIGGKKNIGGIKWVASFVANTANGVLPRSNSMIILNSFENGLPLALMDGTIISAIRAGAVAGLASRYLARKDSKSLGIVGAGAIARTTLMAVCSEIDIEQVEIFDLSRQKAELFAQEMAQKLEIKIIAVSSNAMALEGKDIMITATTAKSPYVKSNWVAPGSLYLHMSGYECEFDVVKDADIIVVDNWYDVKSRNSQTPALMYHQGQLKDDDIYANLDELVANTKPGRVNNEDKIFFNPVGMGIHDLIIANRIFKEAKDQGIGHELPQWEEPYWI